MERILSVVWFNIFPAHFGGQKGIAGFYKALSQHYAVDCLCGSANSRLQDGNLKTVPDLPNSKWQFLNPITWNKIFRQFRQQPYRFVIIEFPYYGIMGYLLKRKGATYLLHAHNIESLRFRKLGKWGWLFLQHYERWSMQQAHLVLFKTKKDQQYAIWHFKIKEEKTYVLPYGIEQTSQSDKKSCRAFLVEKYNLKVDEVILLFAGTLDYLPNAEAVTAIYQQLVPLLCRHLDQPFKVIICGRNKDSRFSYLKNYHHKNVIQAGFVEGVERYFAGADVFINPVQKTFGVQTKILDAIAKELTVVAFEEAGAGLPLYLLNKKLFLAGKNQYGDFVEKIKEAIRGSHSTPVIFYEEFQWQRIVLNFAEQLKNVRP